MSKNNSPKSEDLPKKSSKKDEEEEEEEEIEEDDVEMENGDEQEVLYGFNDDDDDNDEQEEEEEEEGDDSMKVDNTTNSNNNNNNNNSSELTNGRKKKKDETEEEKKQRLLAIKIEKDRLKEVRDTQRKQLKELEKRQRDQLENDQAKSAKERLKFLLERTEIFSHFVSNSSKQPKSKSNGSQPQSTPTKRNNKITEKEEDEEIMKEAIDEEVPHSFNFFTSNPPYIKNGVMRDYQIYGLNWMIQLYERGINGILADEMGLGKTLQTISLLGYLSDYKGIKGPHLIIAPKSTLSGWTKEFKKWCPHLRVVKFHGSKEEREDIKKNHLIFKKFDVCITTYEVAIKEKSTFRKFSWRYLIIDEAHRIKNENSLLSKGVRLFNSQFRLLITGTPLQNNLHELWALLNFLLPDIFSSSDDFDKWFDLENTENQQEVIDKLHKVLRPFLLRRLKSEVEKSLPPKKEIKLFVGLSQLQKELYKNLLSKNLDAIAVASKGSGAKVRLLNICMQLRKACNHPYLFDGVEEEPFTTGDHLINNSGKMVLLDKLLKRLKARGSRVLIFSQMARMLDILEDFMVYREYQYCRIDGSTESQARESQIDEFNEPGSPIFSFLLTTRAGGLGITLNTADVVILFDSDWNPQCDLQAQDRAHRIGQTKPVTVYRFVTERSMEEKMVEKAEMKLHLDALVIQQGRLVEANKGANSDELLYMVRFGADDIFKSKSSTITDEDIDNILKKGEEKTSELDNRIKDLASNPLKLATFDGNLYQFDGVDYKNAQFGGGMFNETFKRERKLIDNQDEYLKNIGAVPMKKVERVQRKFKVPKQALIHDYNFYPKGLAALYAKETAACDKKNDYYESKEKNQPKDGDNTTIQEDDEPEPDFNDLTAEEQALKEKYLEQGFGNWNRFDFRAFIRGCELYGRKAFEKIVETIQTKTEDEVMEYSKVFWKRYKELQDYDKLITRIEKGEERIMKYKETQDSLNHKISKYKNPWQQLKIQYGLKKNKNYTDDEDIFLVCMMHKLGYGAWDELKEEIRKAPQFRFDWFIQTRTPNELKGRCDILLKYIIKEHQEEIEKAKESERKKAEREKKKAAAAAAALAATSPKLSSKKGSTTTTTTTSSKDSKSSSKTLGKRKSPSTSSSNGKSNNNNNNSKDVSTDKSKDKKKIYSDSEDENEQVNTNKTIDDKSKPLKKRGKPSK